MAFQGNFAVGVFMGLLAGLLNGIFLLPLRYAKKWAWENVWLFFAIISTVILPWIAAWAAVPHLFSVFQSVPLFAYVPGILAGLVWGCGQVMYGLGCGMVGIAIGSAIIGCTSIMAGTLGPLLVYSPSKLLSSASLVLFGATILIVAGIYMYGRAGAAKEREAGQERQIVKGAFRTGLLICLICGVLGTAFVYGGKSSETLLASAKALGASPLLAFYVAFVVTFNAGAIPGILFAIYKLRKNATGGNFCETGVFWWNVGMAAAMGVLWYGALLLYGMASEHLGSLGPSLAFALFSSGTVLFANLFGWLTGEWKGASSKTIRGFLFGMTFIVGAIFLIAFGIPA